MRKRKEHLIMVYDDMSKRMCYWVKESELTLIEISGIFEELKADFRDSILDAAYEEAAAEAEKKEQREPWQGEEEE